VHRVDGPGATTAIRRADGHFGCGRLLHAAASVTDAVATAAMAEGAIEGVAADYEVVRRVRDPLQVLALRFRVSVAMVRGFQVCCRAT
jgi:hypothetical protein